MISDMKPVPLGLIVICGLSAQPRADTSSEATMQALLQEVRALRTTLDLTNRITPLVQIAITQMQSADENIRTLTRHIQETREKIFEIGANRNLTADRVKWIEERLGRPGGMDNDLRARLSEEAVQLKYSLEHPLSVEQSLPAQASAAMAQLKTEQARWNELNEKLKSYEQALTHR